MNKLHSFQEFATQNAAKQQQAVQEEQDAKRAESANSFKSLLSEYGVTSPKELTEEQRSEFFEKLRGAEVNESVIISLITEGTRSHVGKIDKKGNIYSVYVHYDGYPEHMVPTLKHYNNKAKVDQLLDLGKQGISFLDKKIGDKQDFNNPEKGTTLFYGRDRGEKGDMSASGKVDKIANYIRDRKNDWAEYVYLFDERDGKWYMADTYEGGDLKLAEGLVTERFRGDDLKKPAVGFIYNRKETQVQVVKMADRAMWMSYPSLKDATDREFNGMIGVSLLDTFKEKFDVEEVEIGGIYDVKESVTNEAIFKAKDFNKTLITYGLDMKADEIYIIKVARVIEAGFPSTSDIPDKRFHDMVGMMLEDNWLKQYDALPNPGDILPAPKKDKAFESVLNESIKVSSKRDANKVYKAYSKIFENATALTADKEVYLGAIRQLFFMAMEDANFAREAYEVMKLIKAPSRFKSFNVNVAELGGFPIAVGPGAINAFLESKYNEISSAGDWGGLRIVEGTALYLDTIGETATAQAMIDAFNAAFESVKTNKGTRLNEGKSAEITTTVDKFFKWYTGGERNWWNPNNDITASMSVDGEHAEDSDEGGAEHIAALKNAKNQKIVITTVDMGGAWENGFVLNGSEYYVDSMDEYLGEARIVEAEIASDDEFKEYAYSVLQKAFGEDFDQAKADEVVNGLLGKADGDYGKAAGMLQASLA